MEIAPDVARTAMQRASRRRSEVQATAEPTKSYSLFVAPPSGEEGQCHDQVTIRWPPASFSASQRPCLKNAAACTHAGGPAIRGFPAARLDKERRLLLPLVD